MPHVYYARQGAVCNLIRHTFLGCTFMSRNYSRQLKTANQTRRSYKKDK